MCSQATVWGDGFGEGGTQIFDKQVDLSMCSTLVYAMPKLQLLELVYSDSEFHRWSIFIQSRTFKDFSTAILDQWLQNRHVILVVVVTVTIQFFSSEHSALWQNVKNLQVHVLTSSCRKTRLFTRRRSGAKQARGNYRLYSSWSWWVLSTLVGEALDHQDWWI